MKLKVSILFSLCVISSVTLADNSYYESAYNVIRPIKVSSKTEAQLIYALYSSLETATNIDAVHMKQTTYLDTLHYKETVCMALTYSKAKFDFLDLNSEYFNSFRMDFLEGEKKGFKVRSDRNGYNCDAITNLILNEASKQ